MYGELTGRHTESAQTIFRRFFIVSVFTIALAYIESAVVVYLRAIFYPEGFSFPLARFGIGNSALWKRLLLTEIGREAATLVILLTGSVLSGRNRRQQAAFFMTIFGVWDIFYYIWLKVLIGWPGSLMDWDILFLIPVTWAGPVLAPVLVSVTMLAFAVIILYRDSRGRSLKVSAMGWAGFFLSAVLIIITFCIGGLGVTGQDYETYFYWSLFAIGVAAAVVLFSQSLQQGE